MSTPSQSQAKYADVEEIAAESTSPVSPQVSEILSNQPSITDGASSQADEPIEEVFDAIEETQTVVEESIVLPNIFTPNGDRVNDLFEIQMGEKLEFQIIVLNQQNQTVFKEDDAHFQ